MTTDDAIGVGIIEDDRLTREGLRALIDGAPGFRCVDAWRTAEEALNSAAGPEILLLDIHLPGISGSQAVPHFRALWPQTVILMLTVYAEEDEIFDSLCRGANGYLLKKTRPERLLESIREASEGGSPMSPEIARKVIHLFRELRPSPKVGAPLTPRERRLLELFADGHSYQGAADAMYVSVHTIRNYIRSIYRKLHVHSKSEAVSKALKAGLI
jgi:DNA-binding NarL/FixJ family response regulator